MGPYVFIGTWITENWMPAAILGSIAVHLFKSLADWHRSRSTTSAPVSLNLGSGPNQGTIDLSQYATKDYVTGEVRSALFTAGAAKEACDQLSGKLERFREEYLRSTTRTDGALAEMVKGVDAIKDSVVDAEHGLSRQIDERVEGVEERLSQKVADGMVGVRAYVDAKPVKADRPSDEAYAHAAWLLMVEVAAMRAVAEVECGPEGAFFDDGQPVILYERHIFSRETGGRFDGSSPEISSPVAGGYGPSRLQHDRLQRAVTLNREAALRSTSWGLFQLMGFNHAACGYPEFQRFITAMYRDVDDHLRAFAMFLRSDSRKVDALRAHDWKAFAFVFNGPQFAKNNYDTKMAQLYARLAAQ